MDIAALIISGLSLVVAGIGTYWSNRRSKEALAESRRAAADAHWSALQEAVQRLIGFDPSAEPIRDRLTNLRIAMLALVDELGDEWEGLDVWLDAERALGATWRWGGNLRSASYGAGEAHGHHRAAAGQP